MIQSSFSRVFVTTVMTIAVAAPLPTLAAVPTRQQNQASLNAAMATLANGSPFVVNSQSTVQARIRPVNRDGMGGTVSASVGAVTRVQPAAEGGPREESRISITSMTVQPTGSSSALPVDGTFVIKTKVIDGKAYIMLDSIPPMVTSLFGKDATAMQGKWVVFDQDVAGGMLAPLFAPFMPLMQPDLWPKALAGQKNVLVISRVEKTWMDGGANMMRARVQLNPSILTALRNAEIAKIDGKDAKKTIKTAEIRARYLKLQSLLNGMEFVAEVDRTSSVMRRLEIGGNVSQPVTSCSSSTTKRMACKTVSNVTVRFNMGMTFKSDTGPLIVRPNRSRVDIAAQK